MKNSMSVEPRDLGPGQGVISVRKGQQNGVDLLYMDARSGLLLRVKGEATAQWEGETGDR